MFFEKEIFASMLDQTVRESQLAKFASRMVALNRAGENIKSSLDISVIQKRVIDHALANKKQLNAISSISLWKGRQ